MKALPKAASLLDGVSKGWPAILSGLKSMLETGKALDDPPRAGHEDSKAMKVIAMDIDKFKPAIVYTIYIASTPEKVWQALTIGGILPEIFFRLCDRGRAEGRRRLHRPRA